jgi:spermidine synthase
MPSSWFAENVTPHDSHRHQLKKIWVSAKTPFQNAVLADTYSFGRCLILDNEIQSAEADEFIYHESLVHPVMALHPRPRDILVLGGGEGATVREILRHPSVHRVTMVDIDRDVIDFCKRHLTAWHQGALGHAKTNLIIEDAQTYMDRTADRFDIIISDLPTPAAGSPLAELYTSDFYRRMMTRLKPGGLFAAQAGSGHWLQIRFHTELRRTLQKLFKVVRPYYAFVPSFDEPWAFVIATQKTDPRALSAARVDKRLGTMRRKLRFYDGETHEGLFRIPKYLRPRPIGGALMPMGHCSFKNRRQR